MKKHFEKERKKKKASVGGGLLCVFPKWFNTKQIFLNVYRWESLYFITVTTQLKTLLRCDHNSIKKKNETKFSQSKFGLMTRYEIGYDQ